MLRPRLRNATLIRNAKVDQRRRRRWAPWHFGGRRSFFVCRCGRKVLQLFAPYRHSWRCRHCYDLTYATWQAGLRYRLILKAQKARERLGGDLGVANPFPAKPKGMHSRRYDRLRARHDQAVEQSLKLLKIYRVAAYWLPSVAPPIWGRSSSCHPLSMKASIKPVIARAAARR